MAQHLRGVSDKGILTTWNVDCLYRGASSGMQTNLDSNFLGWGFLFNRFRGRSLDTMAQFKSSQDLLYYFLKYI